MRAAILEGKVMISCTEFIWVYNELFRFLEERGGKEKVVEFWRGISEVFLKNLRDSIASEGLRGMYRYWSRTLGEEGGRYRLSLYEDMFVIDMHECPSAKLVHQSGRVIPYEDYCEHCRLIYPPLIEAFGYEVEYHIISPERGECRMVVRKPRD